jgi:hypothetical protein
MGIIYYIEQFPYVLGGPSDVVKVDKIHIFAGSIIAGDSSR